MSLVELIARLEKDADARAAALEARVAQESAALEARAAEVRARRQADALEERRRQRRDRLEAALAEARRAHRRQRLEAQHAFVARVFARAAALLPELERDEAYLAVAAAHVAQARRFLEGEAVVARCSPQVAARVPKGEGVTVVEEAMASPGGVVTTVDGRVRVDNTLGARLEAARGRVEVELLRACEVTPC